MDNGGADPYGARSIGEAEWRVTQSLTKSAISWLS
jgi:hypothetical protein